MRSSTRTNATDRTSTHPGAVPSAAVGWTLPIITVLGVAAAIVAAFIGSGALGGTPISEAAGGALSADATPIAPAGAAFGIWSLIYLGLAAYAIWQLSTTARRSPRQEAIRPWALASAVLNAAWIWTVQLGWLAVSVLVIVVLLAVLFRLMLLLAAPRTGGIVEMVVTDGTFGLYLGWVSVAFLANTYAWLTASGMDAVTRIPAGVAGIVAAAAIAVATSLLSRGRIAPALATGWGLAWVADGRTEGAFESPVLVWSAAIAVAAVLVVAVAAAVKSRSAQANPPISPERTAK